MAQRDDPVWAAFTIDDLMTRREESGNRWLPFLDVATLNSGLYVLPAGSTDGQLPHELDELYYVIGGRARLNVNGEDLQVENGSIIYVRARTPHRFHSIEEELRVLVFFSAQERA